MNLTVKRANDVEVTKEGGFRYLDKIKVDLKNGEEHTATCIEMYDDGSGLFIFDDLLADEHVMNEEDTTEGGWLESDLRKYLNGEFFEDLFPDDLKMHMGYVEKNNDYLTIPSKRMMFDDSRLKYFKETKNIIAFMNNELNWYWLKDVVSSTAFARVYSYGNAGTSHASNAGGVRPLFILHPESRRGSRRDDSGLKSEIALLKESMDALQKKLNEIGNKILN